MNNLTLILLICVIVTVVADIILVLCIRFILPYHIRELGFYPADRRKLNIKDAEKLCPCLTIIFPKGTKQRTFFDEIDNKVVRIKRYIKNDPFKIIDVYPFLVSLSIPAYSDDDQKIFACNGFIYSESWLLTTPICVKNESEWFNLTVRSGSPYWDKFGEEHSVIDFTILRPSVIALQVNPKFSKKNLPYPPIKFPFLGDWVHAISLGWDDHMYQKDLEYRYKHKIFEVEEWTSRNCSLESTSVCYEKDSCIEITSKALLTSCHQLIGVKCVKGGINEFSGLDLLMKRVSVQAQKIDDKSCFKIQEDTCPSELETCFKKSLQWF